jgi:hypothetical protein
MLAGVAGGFSYCSKKILAAVSRQPGEKDHQPQMDTNKHK